MKIQKPIASVIILLITFVAVFFLVLPKYRESVDLKIEISNKQAEYNGKSIYYAQISKTLSDLRSKGEALEKIDNSLPLNFTVAPLMYFFGQKASENGLVLRSIGYSPSSSGSVGRQASSATASNQVVKMISFPIDLVGTYDGLKNFLSALEKSSRLFQVESISFSNAQGLGGLNTLNQLEVYNFKMTVRTYSY